MNYQMITSDNALAELCRAASQYPGVALDTEFVRTRTYYPQLGLIQLFDGHNLALIDPLAISQWQPFIDLLANPHITKYLHACSEDLEVFWHRFSQMPVPLVDTQHLAAFTGHPLSWGFAAMVEHYVGIKLDKTESRTDWLARPLTERQCQYAAADVAHLLPIAMQLIEKARAASWLEAALDESCLMVRRRQNILAPQDAWREISNASQLRPRQLACLQRLAAWRLNQARERDMAVNFVVREESLWKVARYMPGSLAELDSLSLAGSEIRYHGNHMLVLVAQAKVLPESALPKPCINLVDMPGYRQVVKTLKAEVQAIASEHHLPPELLASRRQINQLLTHHWRLLPVSLPPELLVGWRKNMAAARLEACLTAY